VSLREFKLQTQKLQFCLETWAVTVANTEAGTEDVVVIKELKGNATDSLRRGPERRSILKYEKAFDHPYITREGKEELGERNVPSPFAVLQRCLETTELSKSSSRIEFGFLLISC
jgi:hypothetical protein